MLGRLLFNLLNAALLTFGLIIIFLGFFTNMQEEMPLAGLANERIRQSSMIVGIIGVVIVATAVLGFCGVNGNVPFFTVIYTLFLGMAAAAFIALAAYVISNAVTLPSLLSANINEQIQKYSTDNTAKTLIDSLQRKFSCCGVNRGYKTNTDVYGRTPIPASCCEEGAPTCTAAEAYKVGCDAKVEQGLQNLAFALAGIAIACALYCAVVAILACCVKKPDN